MKVFLMRGLPGSGKSWWIHTQIARMESHAPKVIISADNYHMETVAGKSVYRFRPERAAHAHNCCLQELVQTVTEGNSVELFVDNTNLSAWEIAPYVRVAEAFGWDVEIVHCVCSVFTSIARNTHNVPAETIYAMSRRVDDLPPWWKQRVICTEPNGSK